MHAKALYATKLPTVRQDADCIALASRLSEGLNKNIAVILLPALKFLLKILRPAYNFVLDLGLLFDIF